MAKKRSRSSFAREKMPLEWAFKRLTATTTATSVSDSIDLDLLQDEVAEIWKI